MLMRLFCYVCLNWMNIKRVKQIPSLISPDVFYFLKVILRLHYLPKFINLCHVM